MKKIRCPQCSVINLEKFVTFPNCAGCGAVLVDGEGRARHGEHDTEVSRIQRPIKPWLWAIVFALGMPIVIAFVVLLMNGSSTQPGFIMINGRMQHVTSNNKIITADLTLDALEKETARRDAPLTGVKLRVSEKFFRDFRFLSIKPTPDRISVLGTGRYYYYSSLPIDTTIRLQVQSTRPGSFVFESSVYADEQYAGDFNAPITVRP